MFHQARIRIIVFHAFEINLALRWAVTSMYASTFDLILTSEVQFRASDFNLSAVSCILLCTYYRLHAHRRICVPLERHRNPHSSSGGSMYILSFLYFSAAADVLRDSYVSFATPCERVRTCRHASAYIRM